MGQTPHFLDKKNVPSKIWLPQKRGAWRRCHIWARAARNWRGFRKDLSIFGFCHKVQVWVKNVIGLSPKSLDGTTIDELLL